MDRDSAETWPLFIVAPRRVAEYGSNRMESVSDPVAASEVLICRGVGIGYSRGDFDLQGRGFQ